MRNGIAKLLMVVAATAAFAIGGTAQTTNDNNHTVTSAVIFNGGKDYLKAISETTQTTDDNTGYAYMEGAWGLNAKSPNYFYTQLFWEQKFWETPIFVHAEFRTTLIEGGFNNIYYAGGAYCIYSKHGFAAIEPLYRYARSDGHGYQLSVVGGWEWKICELAQFIDWWGCKSSAFKPNNLYSETRFYFKVTKRLRLGAVVPLSYSPTTGFTAAFYGGVKWML